jgi:hypothetical protein
MQFIQIGETVLQLDEVQRVEFKGETARVHLKGRLRPCTFTGDHVAGLRNFFGPKPAPVAAPKTEEANG